MSAIFVSLDQRDSAWFDWRKHGITATESPMIAGLSPYCSAWHLWGEKCGKLKPHEVSEYAVRNGVRFESVALELWNQKHDDLALPACCEWSKDRKYRASFDGLTADNCPVEIKCFGKEHLMEIGRLGIDAPCIRHCVMQVHHQIMVAEAGEGHLVFYDPDSEEQIHEFVIKRDEEVLKGIVERGDEFWQFVKSGKEPPYPRDMFIPKGDAREEWAILAREYRECTERMEAWKQGISKEEKRLAEIEEKLKLLMPEDQNYAEFGGVKINRIISKGSIDWKKAYQALPEAVQQDERTLNGFRRKDSVRWDIKATNNVLPDDVIDKSLVDPLILPVRQSLWF